MTSKPIRISVSAVQTWQLCNRKYYYNYMAERVRLGESNRPMHFGSAFHEAQAVWWSRHSDENEAERLIAARHKWEDEAGKYGLSADDKLLGNVLLTGYSVRWSDYGLLFQGQPIVEQKVELPLLDPNGNPDPDFVFVLVMDVRTFDETGRTVIIEHKTTGSKIDEGAAYWSRIQNNIQANSYYMAAEDNGHDVAYVLWDVIRAPELTRRSATPIEKREFYLRDGKYGKKGDPKPGTYLTAETHGEFIERLTNLVLSDPRAFFAREQLTPSESEIHQTRADLWGVGQQIKQACDTGSFPRNRKSCMAFNKPCPYLPVCNDEADIDDPRLYTIKTKPVESKYSF